MRNKNYIRFVLALICGIVIGLLPASHAYAQLGGALHSAGQAVDKGVGAAKQGTENAVDKTKQGAEDVGNGVKKAVTGQDNDNDRYKSSQSTTTTTQESGKSNNMPARNGEKNTSARNGENLPKTAGELPGLALIGIGCFALLGISKLAHEKS